MNVWNVSGRRGGGLGPQMGLPPNFGDRLGTVNPILHSCPPHPIHPSHPHPVTKHTQERRQAPALSVELLRAMEMALVFRLLTWPELIVC